MPENLSASSSSDGSDTESDHKSSTTDHEHSSIEHQDDENFGLSFIFKNRKEITKSRTTIREPLSP